ncbi:sugar ABC transporter [Rhizobium sp. Root708]|uniref:ABC transporter permease n=1 Tax=Rhizobium sp. Root708 TaxID=1736592 RepID=UPI0006FE2E16|nr:ABC transporter permease [Rhizobium sp. Root708]KRB61164.1 sugar ABC transporter [Rhizobium sp. Root708]
MDLLTGLFTTAFLAGGVLALAALGEVLAERVGVVNLGVEGLMAMGALTAIATVAAIPSPTIGFLSALAVGALFGALFAFATVILRANQVLCGLALTLMGSGIASTIGRAYSGMPARATFAPIEVPLLSKIPVIGPAFFSQNILLYLIFIILPVGLSYVMFRTRHGLNLRAVGENPAAADAAGIPVNLIRFAYVTAGSALAAGAGAYLTLTFVPSWSDGVVAGRGWIAVALVIFAGYRPIPAVLSGLLFGFITALGFVGQARGWPVAPAFLSMLPYLGTMAFIIVPVLAWQRMRRIMAAPAAIGVPYYRDVR